MTAKIQSSANVASVIGGAAGKMRENVTKEGIEVMPGQVWRDLDKRMENRHAKVLEVIAGKAKLERCRPDGTCFGGSTTKLAVRRMHKSSTGWALVSGGAA